MALFFYFEDNRANLALFFTVSTLVLYLGPEFFMPSLSTSKGVPIVQTPHAGRIKGVMMHSTDLEREIFAYKGRVQERICT